MKIRHKPAADWNPDTVLRLGHIGYESDTGQFKIGDGVTAWSTLAYASDGGGGGISDGDKGDITVSGTGSTWTIDNSVVSTAKMGGDVTAAGKALLDDADAAAQRTTLGLGTAATQASGAFAAASHSHAQSDVTNLTSDLAALAPLASPTFTGTPVAPTAAGGTNTTQVATTAFVTAAVASVSGGGLGLPQAMSAGRFLK